MAEVWDREKQHFIIRDDLGIQITVKVSLGIITIIIISRMTPSEPFALIVQEVKEDHLVTSSMGPSEGKFAFTSHEAGDHSICLSTKLLNGSGYKPSPDDHEHQVRMHLDIIIGEAKPDNKPADRQHITDLAGRVRDLNDKLRDIRKEQQFQREREAEFRDASERANSRAVFWSLVQGVTLIATCVWQASHLRVRAAGPHVWNLIRG